MTSLIRGSTQVYGIIGYPVAHSRSPVMQNAAFQATGIDAAYLPFEVAPAQLAVAVAGLRALGVCGWNVTIPHKTAIMPLLDELSGEAERAGAVNTVVHRQGRLIGYNTDGAGLILSLERDLEFHVAGRKVVVLGSGGAARGAVAALCAKGAVSVAIGNRTVATAVNLSADLQTIFPETSLTACGMEEISALLPQADVLINTTSVGMHGEEIEGLRLDLLPNTAKVYDMVYGAIATPLVLAAQRRGLRAVNGIGMLIAQGELAFTHWTGVEPPQGVMRAAVILG